jgi:hypothetical protein
MTERYHTNSCADKALFSYEFPTIACISVLALRSKAHAIRILYAVVVPTVSHDKNISFTVSASLEHILRWSNCAKQIYTARAECHDYVRRLGKEVQKRKNTRVCCKQQNEMLDESLRCACAVLYAFMPSLVVTASQ